MSNWSRPLWKPLKSGKTSGTKVVAEVDWISKSATVALELVHPLSVVPRDHSELAKPQEALHNASPECEKIAHLTKAIVSGDENAFAEFYDLYSTRLYRFLVVVTSGQEDLARELHQVVMIKVARKFRVFDSEESLWAWLTRVARNAFIDSLRKRNRSPEQQTETVEPRQFPEASDEKPLLEWLEQGMESLTDEDRALIDSVYFGKRSHNELAAERGQTPKAIESKLARIRTRLREFILTRIKNEDRL